MNMIYLLSLVCVSLALFLLKGPTAFEWPATDMILFFERLNDPQFLLHDYWTNAHASASPRFIFGHMVWWSSKSLGVHWSVMFYIMRVILTVSVPVTCYQALVELVAFNESRTNKYARLLIFASVLLAVSQIPSRVFAVAWWPTIILRVTPHAVSFLLGTLSWLTYARFKGRHLYLTIFSLFLSTLMHPVVGLGSFLVLVILTLKKIRLLSWCAMFIVGCLLPIVIVRRVFAGGADLPVEEFIEIYIRQRHALHYLPSCMMQGFRPVWVVYGITTVLILLPWVARRRPRAALMTGVAAATFYLSTMIVQYIFVEVVPCKAVAVLGPSRWTIYGYWFITFGVASWVNHPGFQCRPVSRLLEVIRVSHVRIVLVTMAVLLTGTTFMMMDDPYQTERDSNPGLYEWINSHTSEAAVFAIIGAHHYSHALPWAARRAVYMWNGFPFSESFFGEFSLRYLNMQKLSTPSMEKLIAINAPKHIIDYALLSSEYGPLFDPDDILYSGEEVFIVKVEDVEADASANMGESIEVPDLRGQSGPHS